jgi:4-diphosphocytidyl-2-C-methyl-D-erythritol kinase
MDLGGEVILSSVVVKCPAKVNLHLRVLGKRPDGYHDIVSLLVPVDTWDSVEVSLKEGETELLCDDPLLPTDDGNLAYKAAKLYLDEVGFDGGARIHLRKAIPVGAGLGGGSSDAAGVLLALNLLLEGKASGEELLLWGGRLGADVPFFLMDGPCIARGIGEILEPVDIHVPLHMVLWYPGWQVSTKWAYENFRGGLTRREKNFKIPRIVEHWEEILALLHNDLESVTQSVHPWVAMAKERLLELGAKGTLMSGSGPTVFGVFDSQEAALRALEEIGAHDGSRAWYTKGISRGHLAEQRMIWETQGGWHV